MKKWLTVAAAILALGAGTVFGRPQAPTTFNTYDGTPPGARPMGMGYAFCAVAHDPAAVAYNPAGLIGIDASLLALSYEAARQTELTGDLKFGSEMLRGRNLNFLALAVSRGSISWRPLADVTVLTGTPGAGNFHTRDIKLNKYTFSAAQQSDEKMAAGLNLSYLSGSIAEYGIDNSTPFAGVVSGYGFSADLGFIFTLAEQIKMGLALENIGGTLWWDDYEKEQLPFILRGGLAYQIEGFTTFAADIEKRYYRKDGDEEQITHFGLEQALGQSLTVRAGTYGSDLNDKNRSRVTFGLGYNQNNYQLALSGEKYALNNTDVYRYVFSLAVPIQ